MSWILKRLTETQPSGYLISLVLEAKGLLKGHWLLRSGADVFTRPPSWLNVMETWNEVSFQCLVFHL